jgi:hypothetical protein
MDTYSFQEGLGQQVFNVPIVWKDGRILFSNMVQHVSEPQKSFLNVFQGIFGFGFFWFRLDFET